VKLENGGRATGNAGAGPNGRSGKISESEE
jgi:hypothetical protein